MMKKTDMLPGWAAAHWSRVLGPLAISMMSLAFVAFAAYFATGATAATVPPWLYALVVVTIMLFVAVVFVMFTMMWKADREAKAGYTTTGGKYPDVPQLDPCTGEILREVGEVLAADDPERQKRLKERLHR